MKIGKKIGSFTGNDNEPFVICSYDSLTHYDRRWGGDEGSPPDEVLDVRFGAQGAHYCTDNEVGGELEIVAGEKRLGTAVCGWSGYKETPVYEMLTSDGDVAGYWIDAHECFERLGQLTLLDDIKSAREKANKTGSVTIAKMCDYFEERATSIDTEIREMEDLLKDYLKQETESGKGENQA